MSRHLRNSIAFLFVARYSRTKIIVHVDDDHGEKEGTVHTAAAADGSRERLIEQYLPLVRAVAREHTREGVDVDDPRAGRLDRADQGRRPVRPGAGVDLAAYARPTVEGEIKRHLTTARPCAPRRLYELHAQLRRLRRELPRTLGRPATPSELAEAAGPQRKRRRPDRLATTLQPLPLDVAEPPAGKDAYDETENRMLLTSCIGRLRQRERAILHLSFYVGLSARDRATAWYSRAGVAFADAALERCRRHLERAADNGSYERCGTTAGVIHSDGWHKSRDGLRRSDRASGACSSACRRLSTRSLPQGGVEQVSLNQFITTAVVSAAGWGDEGERRLCRGSRAHRDQRLLSTWSSSESRASWRFRLVAAWRGGFYRKPRTHLRSFAAMAIRKLLVANRGEIAAPPPGPPRAGHRHAAVAPPERWVGAARALRGRMRGDRRTSRPRSTSAAKQAGADAIHPGYGFSPRTRLRARSRRRA